LIAALEARVRLDAAADLRLSTAVWAGVAPTVSKEGHRAAQQWRKAVEKAAVD